MTYRLEAHPEHLTEQIDVVAQRLGTGDMQARAELYETIGLAEYKALDASIVASIVPEQS